ncbi:MAG TPA: VanZ family protein [Chitinophagaceae bacterium]|nr:VanZ family protein [Chitinophagaceae bacterium]
MSKLTSSFILALLWFIASVILLTLPGSSLPKEKWFDKIWLDKWVHIFIFGMIVFLWCRVLLSKNFANEKLKRYFFLIALTAIAYGVGMEYIQLYFIPGRSFDLWDMAADAVGSLLGLIYCYKRLIKK